MSNAAFLLIVVVISVPPIIYLWWRSRKPTTLMSSIDEFQREMSALAHDPTEPVERKRDPQPLRPIVPNRTNQSLAEKLRAAQRLRQGQSPEETRSRRRSN